MRVERGDRRHVEDRAPALTGHVGPYLADREQRRAQVHLHDEVVPLHRYVEVTHERDGGVVHEDVDATEVLDRRGDHGGDVGFVGEVGRDSQSACAGRLDLAHGLVERSGCSLRMVCGRPCRTRDAAAGLAQRHRRRRSYPTAGAGDDRDLALQVHSRSSLGRTVTVASSIGSK